MVFAEVGLHVAVGEFAREGARRRELRVGRGDRETRRDRIFEPAAAAPAFDQRLALVIAALRRVGQRGRRVAVHHHLARDHARAAPLAGGEERLHRFRPHRAVDDRRRRALAEHLVEEEVRDRRGMRGIREFLLFDERVFLQPVQQLRAIGADDAGLGIMDMRVDEARQDQLAGVIVDHGSRRRLRLDVGGIAGGENAPVRDERRAVVEIAMRALARESGASTKLSTRPRSRRAGAVTTGSPSVAARRCGRFGRAQS